MDPKVEEQEKKSPLKQQQPLINQDQEENSLLENKK
jgi:hypothetical protein